VKVVDRYIVKNLLYCYALCFIALMGLYVVCDAFTRIDRFIKGDGSFLGNLVTYYSVWTPEIYYRIAPVIFIMASMIALSRSNRANELVALKAAGVSLFRVVRPLIFASIVACVIIAIVQERLVPSLADEMRETRNKPIRAIHMSDTSGNIIFVGEYYPDRREVKNMTVTGFYKNGRKRFHLAAASGVHQKRGWRLFGVKKYEFGEDGALKVPPDAAGSPCANVPEMFFKTDILPTDIEGAGKDVDHLTLRQLILQYRRQPASLHLRVQIHRRFAYPLSTFVLLLLGIPFALRQSRHAVFLATVVCISLCLAYYAVTFFLEELGSSGTVSPLAAAWLPPLLFTCIGVTLLDTAKT
jgi:lipopolysaccharide export system permease protein